MLKTGHRRQITTAIKGSGHDVGNDVSYSLVIFLGNFMTYIMLSVPMIQSKRMDAVPSSHLLRF